MSEPGGGSALRTRVEQLAREVVKFGAVGGLGLLINIAASNLLWQTTDLPVVRAGLIATVIAILFNYVGFRYFTYRERDKSGRARELTLFLLFSAVGAVIETGLLYAATYGFGWNTPLQNNIFKVFGIGVATLFRFWSYRTWVFRTLPEKALPEKALPEKALPEKEAVEQAEKFLEAEAEAEPEPEPEEAAVEQPAPAASRLT